MVEHDAGWAGAFSAICSELTAALGDVALSVEHVGSTAVAGLAAKPVIDIDVVIDSRADLPEAIARLHKIGYIHEGDLGIEGREAFRYEGKTHLQNHHLYVCPKDSRELLRHITFREHLRTHPEDVLAYGRIKKEAAVLFPCDIDSYIEYKAAFISEIYSRYGI